jgi:hypothetical protein
VTQRRRMSPEFRLWLAIQLRGTLSGRWTSFGTFYRDVGKRPVMAAFVD